MKGIIGYVLIGLAAVGVLLGATGDILGALQREPAPIDVRLQRVLDRGVERRRSIYPGMILTVDFEPSGRWSGSAGLADTAADQPMAVDSQFGIGSITKTFVAAVVLQLMEEGVIDLDATINNYLPTDLSIDVPHADEITVRMLLNHTSGLPEWLTEAVILQIVEEPSRIWGDEELLAIAFEQGMLFEPGDAFAYSNTDYTLLGLIIEELTGLSWVAQVRERILGPLSLSSTIARSPSDTAVTPQMARGYVKLGREVLDTTLTDPSMAGAAGGNAMFSSTEDLARFIAALLNGELFTSPSTLDEMLDFVDAPDDNGFPYWYGLGVERYEIGGVNYIGHAGGAVGYCSVMYVASDTGTTIAGAINGYNLADVYMDLMLPTIKQLEK